MSHHPCGRCGGLDCYAGMSGPPRGCFAEAAQERHLVAVDPPRRAVVPPFTRGKIHLYAEFNAISEGGRSVGTFGSYSTNRGDGGHAENTANAQRFEALWNAFADVAHPVEALERARRLIETVDGELAATAQESWTVQQRERLRLALDILAGRK